MGNNLNPVAAVSPVCGKLLLTWYNEIFYVNVKAILNSTPKLFESLRNAKTLVRSIRPPRLPLFREPYYSTPSFHPKPIIKPLALEQFLRAGKP